MGESSAGLDSHRFEERREGLLPDLPHQAYLNPVALEKIGAVVAEEVTRVLKPAPDFPRRRPLGQLDRDHCGRRVVVRSYDAVAELAQPSAEPGGHRRYLSEDIARLEPAERGVQRID